MERSRYCETHLKDGLRGVVTKVNEDFATLLEDYLYQVRGVSVSTGIPYSVDKYYEGYSVAGELVSEADLMAFIYSKVGEN